MSTPVFEFKKGGASAEAAAKAQGGQFAKTNFFSLKNDGDRAIVRFITDDPEWLHVKQHQSAPTKNPDPGVTFPWPAAMPAVCRYDEAFGGFYKDCYICDAGIVDAWDKPARPVLRIWAIACTREPVIDGGVTQGYRDARIKVKVRRGDKEEEIEQRALVVINMGMKNFFNGLRGLYGLYGTICDRDYVIQRSGTSKDTDYHIMPLDPIGDPRFSPEVRNVRGEILLPEHPQWKVYEESIAEQGLNLSTLIAGRASDEYFSKFFDPNKPWNWNTDTSSVTSDDAPVAEQQVPPAPEPDAEKLDEMRARLQGYSPAAKPVPAPVGQVYN